MPKTQFTDYQRVIKFLKQKTVRFRTLLYEAERILFIRKIT